MLRIIQTYGTMMVAAMGQTLLLALLSLFFACLLGLFFGLLSTVRNRACNIIGAIYVDAIRGWPLIVLAYFVYFGHSHDDSGNGIQEFPHG